MIGIFDEQTAGINSFRIELEKAGTNYFVLHKSIAYLFSDIATIIAQAKKYNPKILCTHDYKSNFFGLILKILLKLPLIAVYHGDTQTDVKVKIYQLFNRGILKTFDQIVCVSQETKKKIKKHYLFEFYL